MIYGPGVPAGDASRPNYLYDRLVNTSQNFPATTGIGTATTPFSGNLSNYLRQVLSRQGNASESQARCRPLGCIGPY